MTLRRNFGWGMLGNIVYQGCQWGMLVVLAKLTSPHDVGLFALALAICTPVTVFASLNLRPLQVGDAEDRFDLADFLALRSVGVVVSLAVIAGIAAASGYDLHTSLLIVVVGAAQAVMSLREVFNSYMQKHERMWAVAVSQVLAGVGGLAGLWIVVGQGGSLMGGVATMAAARALGLVFWDVPVAGRLSRRLGVEAALRPRWRQRILLKLLWLAMPLAAMASLTSLVSVVPRYIIEKDLGTTALGFFAAIAALPIAGRLVIQAAGVTTLPRLSRYYLDGRPAFTRLLARLTAVCLALGVLGLILAVFAGPWLLEVMFTPDYADYHVLFIWLMVYGTIAYIGGGLGYGLNATRQFWVQPLLFSAVVLVVLAGSWVLVPQMGLIGAALAMTAGRTLQVVVVIGLLWWAVRRRRQHAATDSPTRPPTSRHDQCVMADGEPV